MLQEGTPWTEDHEVALAAIDAYPQNAAPTKAHVYSSMLSLLRDREAYGHPDMVEEDKVLVVFVDGPDEGRDPLVGVSQVLAAAEGTRIFIVHLDDTGGLALL